MGYRSLRATNQGQLESPSKNSDRVANYLEFRSPGPTQIDDTNHSPLFPNLGPRSQRSKRTEEKKSVDNGADDQDFVSSPKSMAPTTSAPQKRIGPSSQHRKRATHVEESRSSSNSTDSCSRPLTRGEAKAKGVDVHVRLAKDWKDNEPYFLLLALLVWQERCASTVDC